MVILDTNIIIEHLRCTKGESLLEVLVKSYPKDDLAISSITVQELYAGKSTANVRQEELMLATISPLRILSYSYETAQRAGTFARDLKRPLSFADAAIAATAIRYSFPLFTLNKKDFKDIPELELFSL